MKQNHIRLLANLLAATTTIAMAQAHPGHEKDDKAIREQYTQAEKHYTERIKANPKAVDGYSRRGDARLFLSKFAGAVEDYEQMIKLDPALDVSHWRLGIAYYYVNRFDKASRQFQIYHNYDNVDRENGIWRFMSQTRHKNMEVARKALLKYEKTDRPPYPWLYALYAGDIKPEQVYEKIEETGFPERYKERVLFHAQLYVGIFHELHGREKEALKHLDAAASNKFGRSTGTYMWQVARVHHDLLAKKLSPKGAEKDSPAEKPKD
jgi:lipoprotein NlpI